MRHFCKQKGRSNLLGNKDKLGELLTVSYLIHISDINFIVFYHCQMFLCVSVKEKIFT